MSNAKSKSINPNIKYAIWIAHSKRCAYSRKFITNFDDLEIDHIIPKSTPRNLIDEKFTKYGLDKEVGIDTVNNLLPCCRTLNRLKGKRPFSEENERYFIELAKSKKAKIDKEITSFNRSVDKFKNNAIIKAIEAEKLVKTKYRKFEDGRIVGQSSFWHSTNKVVINAILPTPSRLDGTCVIEFYNSDFMITFSHKEITDLFNIKTIQELENSIGKSKFRKNKEIFVTLSNSALHLPKETYIEFINLLFDFLSEYKKSYFNNLEILGAKDFKRYANSDYFILMKTDRNSWKKLIKHSELFDIDKGNSKEYCFNYNENYIVALDEKFNNIKFMLLPKQVKPSSFPSFLKPDNELYIVWKKPSNEDILRVNEGIVWKADQTYNWLIEFFKNN